MLFKLPRTCWPLILELIFWLLASFRPERHRFRAKESTVGLHMSGLTGIVQALEVVKGSGRSPDF